MAGSDTVSKIGGLAWVLAAVFVAWLFAVGIGPIVRLVPWKCEETVAGMLSPLSQGKVSGGNAKSEALLKRLIDRVYPIDPDDDRFSIQVRIIKDSSINAFAELGGRISVDTGLLEGAGSPEEFLGVLSHEIEHVRRRHILEAFAVRLLTVEGLKMIFVSHGSPADARWSNFFLRMSFSRYQEAEADEGALKRLQKAQVDNRGYENFFERTRGLGVIPAFLSDHPSSQARSEMIKNFRNGKTGPVLSEDEWKSFKESYR